MVDYLNEYSTKQLLDEFGKGGHKPGSGSAAALLGMVSAKLILTVIKLTKERGRGERYKANLSKLLIIQAEIDQRIFPELERLFHEDSVRFAEVIKLRREAKKTKDWYKKKQIQERALLALQPATEIPVEIANLCLELADFALSVFDHGVQKARGDSSVALNSALSGVVGCASIVDLNLLSFGSDDWTDKIRNQTKLIREKYDRLISDSATRGKKLKSEADEKDLYEKAINSILVRAWDEAKLSSQQIEGLATRLQNTMWKYRGLIWKENMSNDPMAILDPVNALKILGYKVNKPTALGQHEVNGELLEIAGVIDKQNKTVEISQKFLPPVINFTTAHELGHALLHDQRILHRDKPLDGSLIKGSRNRTEVQADKFATYFLMPRKQVERAFETRFFTKKFIINKDSVFALNEDYVGKFREKCKNLRGLALYIAAVEHFSTNHFPSISKLFNVSVEAMAIRLEELELIEF